MELKVSGILSIPLSEIELTAIRARGAGGQNVNKVSSAIHLRFDIPSSSLPGEIKDRLLRLRDQRISDAGVIIVKAMRYRQQAQNREDALERLADLITSVSRPVKKRRPTRPSHSSRRKRLDHKKIRGQQKKMRARVKF